MSRLGRLLRHGLRGSPRGDLGVARWRAAGRRGLERSTLISRLAPPVAPGARRRTRSPGACDSASASPVPSPSASLMYALREAERRRRWWRSLALTRGALALVAVGSARRDDPAAALRHRSRGADARRPRAGRVRHGARGRLPRGASSDPRGRRACVRWSGCAALLLVATAVDRPAHGQDDPERRAAAPPGGRRLAAAATHRRARAAEC